MTMKQSIFGKNILQKITPHLSVELNEHIESVALSCLQTYFKNYMVSENVKKYAEAIKAYEIDGRQWQPLNYLSGVMSLEHSKLSAKRQPLLFVQEDEAEQIWSKYDISWESVDKYFELYQCQVNHEKLFGRKGVQPPRSSNQAAQDIANNILNTLVENFPHLISEGFTHVPGFSSSR
ncbi:TPA: hypothetical protein ACT96X_002475 [Legionella pneumophila]|uniref:hypothetical protein n=1 Tax=Legionella pneumophila TaxID=446 RepID=UPI000AB7B118|nr:hypothetical protein [Legionella pneumophila]HAT1658613.1 hypothetical protein [Legionella pneumophila]HAT6937485.1 hypothetical protein [Legionella pneumophila]HAU1192494.1 hypothetical protein [Legionella pneumophila]HAU1656905.1 hypothetical protein [Legionella pneumophila]HBD7102784.1 hypothetical protein [Legionella pneumophila]